MLRKCVLIFGLIALFRQASADITGLDFGTYTSGTINNYVDRLLALVRPAIVDNGLDPFRVETIVRDFWFKPLFINYTGQIELKNGWVQDLSTIRRFGNATIKYEKKMLTVDAYLNVECLMAKFDYKAKLLNIGPSGRLSAIVRNQQIRYSMLVDFERVTFHLQQFALVKNDQVKIQMTGLGLADFLMNAVMNAVTAVVKDSVMKSIGRQIRSELEALIEKIPPLLPPAPMNDDQHPSLLDLAILLSEGMDLVGQEDLMYDSLS